MGLGNELSKLAFTTACSSTRALAEPSASIAACTRTFPTVSVPVLSAQRTSMLPKSSMAASRFTTTRRSAMREAPRARFTLITAGRSCGVSPTASARAKRKESTTGRCRYTFTANMANTSTSVTSASR